MPSIATRQFRVIPITMPEIPSLTQLYKEQPDIFPQSENPAPHRPVASYNNRVSLIRADITRLQVDAVVNAANSSLRGGGGVDGAIHRAAGPDLLHQCMKVGPCQTGSAKITEGFDLPSKKIIHAVGPVYFQLENEEAEARLRGCYTTSLELAVKNNCRTIAFSSISTGVYGYPPEDAALVALDVVRTFLEGPESHKLDRIIFCTFELKDEDAYLEHIP